MSDLQENIQKIKQESVKVSREMREKALSSIITAFGLVAGLAWNEAIQSLINSVFALNRNSLVAKFIYAVVMTSVLVIVTIYLTRILKKEKDS